jgi:hypothetical protein
MELKITNMTFHIYISCSGFFVVNFCHFKKNIFSKKNILLQIPLIWGEKTQKRILKNSTQNCGNYLQHEISKGA